MISDTLALRNRRTYALGPVSTEWPASERQHQSCLECGCCLDSAVAGAHRAFDVACRSSRARAGRASRRPGLRASSRCNLWYCAVTACEAERQSAPAPRRGERRALMPETVLGLTGGGAALVAGWPAYLALR